MNSTKYSELTKEQLAAEIKKRRDSGSNIAVDLRAGNETLIAALELDDVSEGNADEDERKDVEELKNQLPKDTVAPSHATIPLDSEFVSKAKHKETGHIYECAHVPGDVYSKPIKARIPKQASGHPGLYWEGTEDEFEAAFRPI